MHNPDTDFSLKPLVCFSNPGEIDIRAVTTLGVNVKSDASAIGYFGTGLKYALAVLLREKQEVEIWSGPKCYVFGVSTETIREKPFGIITMSCAGSPTQSLGFTTDLGKNWGLAQAYRELWSNTMDEGGMVSEGHPRFLTETAPADFSSIHQLSDWSKPGRTVIIVRGVAFAETHATRFGPILLPRGLVKLGETPQIEVYAGQSTELYYRGIAVFHLDKPSLFTYNIISEQVLTEDRTLSGGTYYPAEYAKRWLTSKASKGLVTTAMLGGEASFEGNLSFYFESEASEEFFAGMEQAARQNPVAANQSGLKLLMKLRAAKGEEIEYAPALLTSNEEASLASARAELDEWGYPSARFRLIVTESCGQDVLGLALKPDRIVLARATLSDPDKLRGTLLEEIVHLRFGVSDCTRAMQEVLINELVRLGRRISATEIARLELPSFMPVSAPSDDGIPF